MLSCYSKVVVPYDGSELSEKALRTAIKLVSADKRIELHVLHIIKPFNTLEMLEKNYKAAFYMRVERVDASRSPYTILAIRFMFD